MSLSLGERKVRYGIVRKLKDIIKLNKELFSTITFDNESEFAGASELEDDNTLIYFAHAYSAWERSTNENFNKLLREFIPKGKPITKNFSPLGERR
ncbi:MAG TPA: IS30 family transposase [Tepidimicrobium sp.]|nr:IS30 family transposase [Tepidimicrobium sp.]